VVLAYLCLHYCLFHCVLFPMNTSHSLKAIACSKDHRVLRWLLQCSASFFHFHPASYSCVN
jgi:hypothetical protein